MEATRNRVNTIKKFVYSSDLKQIHKSNKEEKHPLHSDFSSAMFQSQRLSIKKKY